MDYRHHGTFGEPSRNVRIADFYEKVIKVKADVAAALD
jgi:hypothetical protein